MKETSTKLSLKNDVVFKAVYGRDTSESKFLLIAMLNLILGRREDPIVDLIYENPFHIREHRNDKEHILDIKVKTTSGELINIEMQLMIQDEPIKRILHYHGDTIRESLKKGQSYDKMLKSITICILDDVIFPQTKEFLNVFRFLEEKAHFLLTEQTAIYFVELPKVNPNQKPVTELSPLELYLEYLRCASEEESDYVNALIGQGGKELEMTQYKLEKVTEDDRLRAMAISHERWLIDECDRRITRERAEKWIREEKAKLQEDKVKLQENEARLQEDEVKLEAGRASLRESETRLRESETRLRESETRLRESETSLRESEIRLRESETRLQESETRLQEEAKNNAQRQIVKNMAESGMDTEKIAKITKLSREIVAGYLSK